MKERNIFQVSDFDWDEGNWPKCGKHGVSRSEIERMFFSDPWIFLMTGTLIQKPDFWQSDLMEKGNMYLLLLHSAPIRENCLFVP